MLDIWVQNTDERVRLVFQKSLDNKAFIMWIEEKRATFALRLLRIENVISIFYHGKWVLNLIEGYAVEI